MRTVLMVLLFALVIGAGVVKADSVGVAKSAAELQAAEQRAFEYHFDININRTRKIPVVFVWCVCKAQRNRIVWAYGEGEVGRIKAVFREAMYDACGGCYAEPVVEVKK